MVYMITYDLNSQGQKYDELIKAIKDSSLFWCSYWKSSYLVKSSLSIFQFEANLSPFLDANDRLIIVEATKTYRGWLTDEQWTFINENIFV